MIYPKIMQKMTNNQNYRLNKQNNLKSLKMINQQIYFSNNNIDILFQDKSTTKNYLFEKKTDIINTKVVFII